MRAGRVARARGAVCSSTRPHFRQSRSVGLSSCGTGNSTVMRKRWNFVPTWTGRRVHARALTVDRAALGTPVDGMGRPGADPEDWTEPELLRLLDMLSREDSSRHR